MVKINSFEKAKIAFWALSPLFLAMFLGVSVGTPYSAFAGMVLLGLLTLIYNKIGGKQQEIFKVYALCVFFLLAMSIGGWADQGIRG